MPQPSLLPGERPDVGVRITIEDHAAVLEAAMTITIELRKLDGEWETFAILPLYGYGRDFLASSVEDIVHAFHFEDRRAILREVQRNERAASTHHRKHSRIS